MNISAGAKTDTGQRPNNEDRYAVVDTRKRQIRADGVLIIADGMGGRSFGEQAATAAVETVEDALAELLDSRQVGEIVVADALTTALRRANARVYELASADDDRKGMGTTCVAAVVEGDRLYVAHAGDSRAYLLRDGLLRQVTHDHSYVAEQVRAGAITEEGARSSRFRNIITRAIGIEPALDAEVSEADVQPGDMLLLCTDGLSNTVAEEDIMRTLMQAPSPQAAADRLVQMAVKSGGRDNITAIAARLQAGTRTLRMQVADLVRPTPQPADVLLPSETHTNGAVSVTHPASRPERVSRWPAVAGLLLALLLCAGVSAVWLGHLLAQDGYAFQPAPPFAVKPMPSPPPKPPDLTHLAYDPPKPFGFAPVRGSFLQVSPVDGTVTVASLTGTVIGLEPVSGKIHYKYHLPFVKPQPPAPAGSVGANGVTLHTATDIQGNLYVSNAVTRTVTKYRANGDPLGLITRALKNPQAIGAAPDGTLYLVDGERLMALHAQPSSAPLPPVPAIIPPKPAALPVAHPAPPTPAASVYSHGYRTYRHYGYRHFGYRR